MTQARLSAARIWRFTRGWCRANVDHVRAAWERRTHADRRANPASLADEIRASAPCGFMLSTGRSGTALLAELLAGAGAASAYHHARPDLPWLSARAYQELDAQPDAWRLAFLHARYEHVREAWLRGRAFVETNHRLTFYAPVIADSFRQARFVHLVRHPGEFARSALRRGYYAGGPGDEGRIAPRPDDPCFADWPRLQPLARIAWLWNATNAFCEQFKKNHGARVLTVRSSDLFASPAAYEAICEHLGLVPQSSRRVAAGLRRLVNAQSDGETPPYEQWPDSDRSELRALTPLAAAYGFDV